MRKYLNLRGTPKDYKNINKRLKRLKENGLIIVHKKTTKTSIHGAKYYKLSDKGVYFLVRNMELPLSKYITISDLFRKLLANYGEDVLFINLLYPYFELGTIQHLVGSVHLYYIWRYLGSCCLQLQNTAEMKKNIEGGGEEIYIWGGVGGVAPGETKKLTELQDTRLLEYLHRNFHLDWLENAEITKFENDKILKIWYGSKSVVIVLDKSGAKAALKLNRRTAMELNVDNLRLGKSISPYSLNVPVGTDEINFNLELHDRINQLASELALALVSLPTDKNDIEILSKDNKFIVLLKRTKTKLDKKIMLFLSSDS
jgi:hypothetical protein